jgi:hypothetical protein
MTTPGGVALAGAVALDVQPDARDFYPRLRAQVVPAADAVGRDIGRQMSAPIVDQVGGAVREGVRDGGRGAGAQGAKVGEDVGAAIARSLKAKVEAALKNLPDAKIDGDDGPLTRKLQNVRRQFEQLRDQEIGADSGDLDVAIARAQALRKELSTLARAVEKVRESGGEIPLDLDVLKAGADVTRLHRELNDFQRDAAKPVTVDVKVGAFERELKAKVEAAIAQLPTIELKADSTDAEIELVRIRAELEKLQAKKIGIDIDAGAALAEVAALQAALVRLAAEHPNVQIEADAAAAAAKIAGVVAQAEAAGMISPTINMDVDTGGAQANIAALVFSAVGARIALIGLASSGALLAVSIVPAAAACVVAIMAIAPAAVVALGAIGALVLAFAGVFGALQSMDQAQGKAGGSAASLAAHQNAVASATAQVESATRSLANTKANAADAEARANRQVEDSERALTDAKLAALRAEQQLADAREAARRGLEDMAGNVADNALAQRGALLDVTEARAKLDAATLNPQATNLERQRAKLTYDQAVRRIEDLKLRGDRLAADKAKADKAGIEGSSQVTAAQDRIAQAHERVRKAAEAVTEAHRAQATQARQSAFAIEQAEQGVINAQRSLAQASQQTGEQGSAAMNKFRDSMAALSPEGRAFVLFLHGLKPVLGELKRAAEAGLLPGAQAGLAALLTVKGPILSFVSTISTALGGLFEAAGKALASPFWIDFFKQIETFAGPAIQTFGSIIGDLAKGFGSLILAFLPVSAQMGSGLADMAAGFAEWAASLSQSEGFKKFIAYVVDNSPMLLSLLGQLVVLVINLGISLAPLGAIMLKVLAVFVEWLASLDPGVLLALVGAVATLAAVIIGATAPIWLIAIAVVAVVGAIVYAYTHFTIFRTIVDTVINAVATAALWLWNVVLKPTWDAIVAGVQWLGSIFSWLWTNILSPTFTVIAAIATWLWVNILQPIFSGIVFVVQNILGPIFLTLYHMFVEPAFTAIKLAIQVAWVFIQVTFGVIKLLLMALGAVFMWLWEHGVKQAFGAIVDFISWAWNAGIKPALEAFGGFIEKWVAPKIKAGMEIIRGIWDKLSNLLGTPLRLFIDVVLNKGLIGGFNWIADKVGIDKIKPIDIQGFATGGPVYGAGNGTSDSIPAWLSHGEYVIPAHIVAKMGVPFFDWLINAKSAGNGPPATRPGDGSQGLAFAKGGLVSWLSSAWKTITDPVGFVKDKVAGAIRSAIPGASWLIGMLSATGNKLLGGLLNWVQGKITNLVTDDGYVGPLTADIKGVQSWMQAQAGKPYVWAASGPQGYDCSGFASAALNVLRGKANPYSRLFSTYNEAQFFPHPGMGPFTAGWAGPGEKGGGSVGHTAINVGGLRGEARGGGAGVLIGAKAVPVTSFAHTGHYAKGGLVHRGTYDSGGWLMPGLTAAYNGTGVPERVLTGPEWDRIASSRQVAGDQHTHYSYQISTNAVSLDAAQLQALQARQEALARVGRPR